LQLLQLCPYCRQDGHIEMEEGRHRKRHWLQVGRGMQACTHCWRRMLMHIQKMEKCKIIGSACDVFEKAVGRSNELEAIIHAHRCRLSNHQCKKESCCPSRSQNDKMPKYPRPQHQTKSVTETAPWQFISFKVFPSTTDLLFWDPR